MLPATELDNTNNEFSEVIKKASENVQAEIEDSQIKKKRGRKPKSEKSSLKPESEDINKPIKLEIEQVSVMAQQGLAVLGVLLAKGLKCPDLEFTPDESKALGDSMANASQYFMPEIHPKWIALGMLCTTTGFITWSKMTAYNSHIEKNKVKLDDGVLKGE